MVLADRLCRLRMQLGMSEVELALRIGYDKTGAGRIREYEQGRREPSLNMLVRIANAYGMSLSKLLEGVT